MARPRKNPFGERKETGIGYDGTRTNNPYATPTKSRKRRQQWDMANQANLMWEEKQAAKQRAADNRARLEANRIAAQNEKVNKKAREAWVRKNNIDPSEIDHWYQEGGTQKPYFNQTKDWESQGFEANEFGVASEVFRNRKGAYERRDPLKTGNYKTDPKTGEIYITLPDGTKYPIGTNKEKYFEAVQKKAVEQANAFELNKEQEAQNKGYEVDKKRAEVSAQQRQIDHRKKTIKGYEAGEKNVRKLTSQNKQFEEDYTKLQALEEEQARLQSQKTESDYESILQARYTNYLKTRPYTGSLDESLRSLDEYEEKGSLFRNIGPAGAFYMAPLDQGTENEEKRPPEAVPVNTSEGKLQVTPPEDDQSNTTIEVQAIGESLNSGTTVQDNKVKITANHAENNPKDEEAQVKAAIAKDKQANRNSPTSEKAQAQIPVILNAPDVSLSKLYQSIDELTNTDEGKPKLPIGTAGFDGSNISVAKKQLQEEAKEYSLKYIFQQLLADLDNDTIKSQIHSYLLMGNDVGSIFGFGKNKIAPSKQSSYEDMRTGMAFKTLKNNPTKVKNWEKKLIAKRLQEHGYIFAAPINVEPTAEWFDQNINVLALENTQKRMKDHYKQERDHKGTEWQHVEVDERTGLGFSMRLQEGNKGKPIFEYKIDGDLGDSSITKVKEYKSWDKLTMKEHMDFVSENLAVSRQDVGWFQDTLNRFAKKYARSWYDFAYLFGRRFDPKGTEEAKKLINESYDKLFPTSVASDFKARTSTAAQTWTGLVDGFAQLWQFSQAYSIGGTFGAYSTNFAITSEAMVSEAFEAGMSPQGTVALYANAALIAGVDSLSNLFLLKSGSVFKNGLSKSAYQKLVATAGGRYLTATGGLLVKGGVEGGTEVVQTFWENVYAKSSYDPDRKYYKGGLVSFYVGALLGSTMGTRSFVTDISQAKQKAKDVQVATEELKKIEDAEKGGNTAKEELSKNADEEVSLGDIIDARNSVTAAHANKAASLLNIGVARQTVAGILANQNISPETQEAILLSASTGGTALYNAIAVGNQYSQDIPILSEQDINAIFAALEVNGEATLSEKDAAVAALEGYIFIAREAENILENGKATLDEYAQPLIDIGVATQDSDGGMKVNASAARILPHNLAERVRKEADVQARGKIDTNVESALEGDTATDSAIDENIENGRETISAVADDVLNEPTKTKYEIRIVPKNDPENYIALTPMELSSVEKGQEIGETNAKQLGMVGEYEIEVTQLDSPQTQAEPELKPAKKVDTEEVTEIELGNKKVPVEKYRADLEKSYAFRETEMLEGQKRIIGESDLNSQDPQFRARGRIKIEVIDAELAKRQSQDVEQAEVKEALDSLNQNLKSEYDYFKSGSDSNTGRTWDVPKQIAENEYTDLKPLTEEELNGKYSNLQKQARDFEKLGTGKKIIFVRGGKDSANGAVDYQSNPDLLFINADSVVDPSSIIHHENLHTVERGTEQEQKLYEEFREKVDDIIPESALGLAPNFDEIYENSFGTSEGLATARDSMLAVGGSQVKLEAVHNIIGDVGHPNVSSTPVDGKITYGTKDNLTTEQVTSIQKAYVDLLAKVAALRTQSEQTSDLTDDQRATLDEEQAREADAIADAQTQREAVEDEAGIRPVSSTGEFGTARPGTGEFGQDKPTGQNRTDGVDIKDDQGTIQTPQENVQEDINDPATFTGEGESVRQREENEEEEEEPIQEQASPNEERVLTPQVETPVGKPLRKSSRLVENYEEDYVISAIIDEGGLISLSRYKKENNKEIFNRNKAEWDDVPYLGNPALNGIYSKTGGMMPDQMMRALVGRGIFGEYDSLSKMWEAIDKAATFAKSRTANEKTQEEDWSKEERLSLLPIQLKTSSKQQIKLVDNLNKSQPWAQKFIPVDIGSVDDRINLSFIFALEQRTGRRIILMEPASKDDTGAKMSGLVSGDTIFVNLDGDKAPLATTMHEFMHTVEKQSPELYNQFKRAVIKAARSFPELVNTVTGQYLDVYKGDWSKVESEAIANIAGDLAMDRKFWNKFLAKEPKISEKIVGSFVSFLDSLRNKFRRTPRNGRTWEAVDALSGLDEVRASLADVITQSQNYNRIVGSGKTFPVLGDLKMFALDPDQGSFNFDSAPARKGIKKVQQQFLNFESKKKEPRRTLPKPEPEKLPKATGEIKDFGQKIGGAKKDIYAAYVEKMESFVGDDANITMAKNFPMPNYKQLLQEGVSPETLASIAAIRDSIPSKPKGRIKLKRWAESFRTLREIANELLLNPDSEKANAWKEIITKEGVSKNVDNNPYSFIKLPPKEEQYEMRKRAGISPANHANYELGKIARKTMLYRALGISDFTSAKGWTIGYFRGVLYDEQGEPLDKPKNGFVAKYNGRAKITAPKSFKADTQEAIMEIADQIKRVMRTEGTPDKEDKRRKPYGVYKNRVDQSIYIAKKVGRRVVRLKDGFKDVTEAHAYLRANLDEIEKLFNEKKEVKLRREDNRPREGERLRKPKENIEPDQFMSRFGFRGVEFGNYVENKRRQQNLNETYDALNDLGAVLNIPAEALSLDGTLALAFGARGSGGKGAASAHYEPIKIAINLTKKKGAGSLAHEWFHGLDNYFSKLNERDGADVGAGGYITEKISVYSDGTSSYPTPKYLDEEVIKGFASLIKAIEKSDFKKRAKNLDEARAEDYYSTNVELAARAFEGYVVNKLGGTGITNDFLANINPEGGAYPTSQEQTETFTPLFDILFSQMSYAKTDRGTKLFALDPETDAKYLDLAKNPKKNEKALQKMVDTAAKNAGFNVGPVKHHTNKKFNVFKNIKPYAPTQASTNKGFYFSELDSADNSGQFLTNNRVVKAYIKLQNPLEVEVFEDTFGKKNWSDSSFIFREDAEQLQEQGYDGVIGKQRNGEIFEYVVFEPEQIKSSDLVTKDDQGNVIPLSERFSPERKDIRFALDPETDAEYLRLAEDPDNNYWNLTKLLDRAAKIAGYKFKGWHGTPDGRFLDSDPVFRPKEWADTGVHWFAEDYNTATTYADDTRAFDYQNAEPRTDYYYIKIDNPYMVDGKGAKWRSAQGAGKTRNVIEKALEEGKDGVIIENVRDDYQTGVVRGDKPTTTYSVFESEQIKKADPVTYDNEGNVIPLSERFDPEREDTRFALDPEDKPPFYSGVIKSIKDKLQDNITVEQALGFFKPGKTAGVKKAEVAWMGLEEWILDRYNDQDKGIVKKDDLLKFAEDNQFKLVTVEDRGHYSRYTQKGGENYKTILFEFVPPYGEQRYASKHFGGGGRNLAFHVRVKDRFDDQGNKILFVEEIQSDWGSDYNSYISNVENQKKIFDKMAPENAEMAELAKKTAQEVSRLVATGFGSSTGGIDLIDKVDKYQKTLSGLTKFYPDNTEQYRNIIFLRQVLPIIKRNLGQIATHSDAINNFENYDFKYKNTDVKETGKLKGGPYDHAYKPKILSDLFHLEDTLGRNLDLLKNFKNIDPPAPEGTKIPSLEKAIREHAKYSEISYEEAASSLNAFDDLGNLGGMLTTLQLYEKSLSPAYTLASDILYKEPIAYMPFVRSYHEPVLKHIVRLAVKNDYHAISWATGAQQIALYTEKLRQEVNSISVEKRNNDEVDLTVDGVQSGEFKLGKVPLEGMVMRGGELQGKTLDNIVGKAVANKIRRDMATEDSKKYSGDDLTVGGQLHKMLYDIAVPSFLKKYTKKFNGIIENRPVLLEPRALGLTTRVKNAYRKATDKSKKLIEDQIMSSLRQPEGVDTPIENQTLRGDYIDLLEKVKSTKNEVIEEHGKIPDYVFTTMGEPSYSPERFAEYIDLFVQAREFGQRVKKYFADIHVEVMQPFYSFDVADVAEQAVNKVFSKYKVGFSHSVLDNSNDLRVGLKHKIVSIKRGGYEVAPDGKVLEVDSGIQNMIGSLLEDTGYYEDDNLAFRTEIQNKIEVANANTALRFDRDAKGELLIDRRYYYNNAQLPYVGQPKMSKEEIDLAESIQDFIIKTPFSLEDAYLRLGNELKSINPVTYGYNVLDAQREVDNYVIRNIGSLGRKFADNPTLILTPEMKDSNLGDDTPLFALDPVEGKKLAAIKGKGEFTKALDRAPSEAILSAYDHIPATEENEDKLYALADKVEQTLLPVDDPNPVSSNFKTKVASQVGKFIREGQPKQIVEDLINERQRLENYEGHPDLLAKVEDREYEETVMSRPKPVEKTKRQQNFINLYNKYKDNPKSSYFKAASKALEKDFGKDWKNIAEGVAPDSTRYALDPENQNQDYNAKKAQQDRATAELLDTRRKVKEAKKEDKKQKRKEKIEAAKRQRKRFFAGKYDYLDFMSGTYEGSGKAGSTLRDAETNVAKVKAAVKEYSEQLSRELKLRVGIPFWKFLSRGKRLRQFAAELHATAARLNVESYNPNPDSTGSNFIFRGFDARMGFMPESEAEARGLVKGSIYTEEHEGDTHTLKLGNYVPEMEGYLLVQRFTAEEQQRIYTDFLNKYPDLGIFLERFINPLLGNARFTSSSGTKTPIFNRESLKQAFGDTELGDPGFVEGYTPDVAIATILGGAALKAKEKFEKDTFRRKLGAFNLKTSGARGVKTGAAREKGQTLDIFEGFDVRALESHLERTSRQNAYKLLEASTKPLPEEGLPDGHIEISKETLNGILKGMLLVMGDKSARGTSLNKFWKDAVANPDLTSYTDKVLFDEKDANYDEREKKILEFLFGDKNASRFIGTDRMMDIPTYEALIDNLSARHTKFDGLGRAVQTILGQVITSYLTAPATILFNWLAPNLQAASAGAFRINKAAIYLATGVKNPEDRRRAEYELRAGLQTLKGLATRRFSNYAGINAFLTGDDYLRGKLSDEDYDKGAGKLLLEGQIGKSIKAVTDRRTKYGEIVPRELFDNNTLVSGIERIEPKDSIIKDLFNLKGGSAILKLAQFHEMDPTVKQNLVYASYKAHAQMAYNDAVREAKAKGQKIDTPKKKWMRDWMKTVKDTDAIHEEARGTAMLFAFDYSNIPMWLDSKHPVMQAAKPALIPFSNFIYNYGKLLTKITPIGIIPEAVVSKGKKDKLGGAEWRNAASGLSMFAIATLLWDMLGDDEEDESKLKAGKIGTNMDINNKFIKKFWMMTGGKINLDEMPDIFGSKITNAVRAYFEAYGAEKASGHELWLRGRALPYLNILATQDLWIRAFKDKLKGEEVDFRDVLSETKDMAMEFVPRGPVAALFTENKYDENKTQPEEWGAFTFDIATSRSMVPASYWRFIQRLVDPIYRRKYPSDTFEFNETSTDQFINEWKRSIPFLSKTMLPAGSMKTLKLNRETQVGDEDSEEYVETTSFDHAMLQREDVKADLSQLADMGIDLSESTRVLTDKDGELVIKYPDPTTLRIVTPAERIVTMLARIESIPSTERALARTGLEDSKAMDRLIAKAVNNPYSLEKTDKKALQAWAEYTHSTEYHDSIRNVINAEGSLAERLQREESIDGMPINYNKDGKEIPLPKDFLRKIVENMSRDQYGNLVNASDNRPMNLSLHKMWKVVPIDEENVSEFLNPMNYTLENKKKSTSYKRMLPYTKEGLELPDKVFKTK